MMSIQVGGWSWMQWRAGKFSDKEYLIWTVTMLSGQSAGGVDCAINGAWGAMFLNIFFFVSTILGGIKRYRGMS